MSILDEITEDWQREGLSPTWAKLQAARAEFDALSTEVAEARKETGEQARLNGMGAEREARLMSERDGLRAARIAYASEFPPIPDGDDAGLPAVDRIHENIRRLKAENAELKAKLTKKAELLRGCYAADHKRQKRVAELEAAVAEAIPAMRDYARKNQKHYFE